MQNFQFHGRKEKGGHTCRLHHRISPLAVRSGVYSFSSCSANKAVFAVATAIKKIAAYFFSLL